jgi:probable O-glycosylation ligase (exosortase A-associated)
MGLMFLRLKQKVVLLPVIAGALLLVILFAPDAWKQRMNPSKEDGLDGSAYSRLNAWNFAYSLAKEYPITGGGFKTFTPELFVRYAPNGRDVKAPHSVYFGVLAEHGFVGLGLYLLLLGSTLFSLQWVIKWGSGYGLDQATNYARMLQFSLLGFMASGIFLSRAYFDYYFTLVACVVVLKHLTRRALAEPADAEDYTADETTGALALSGHGTAS